jgi:hypothetical protein
VAAVKLFGFVVLLAAIFVWAHAVGKTVGPVTTGHSPVQYTGSGPATGGTNMGGMNMGGRP